MLAKPLLLFHLCSHSVEEIVRAGKAEPEQNDREEQKERQQKECKDTTGFE